MKSISSGSDTELVFTGEVALPLDGTAVFYANSTTIPKRIIILAQMTSFIADATLTWKIKVGTGSAQAKEILTGTLANIAGVKQTWQSPEIILTSISTNWDTVKVTFQSDKADGDIDVETEIFDLELGDTNNRVNVGTIMDVVPELTNDLLNVNTASVGGATPISITDITDQTERSDGTLDRLDDLTKASGNGDLAAIKTNIGTPANIDSGGATIADNLKKLADDNDGGDFNASQDSLRELRKRGDHAWLTGAGATAAHTYTADAITIIIGDADSGTVANTYVVDGTGMVIGEVASGIRMHVTADFTAVAGENPKTVEIWCGYSGNGNHHIDVLAYNYTDDTEEKIGEIPDDGGDIEPYSFGLNPAHIDGDASMQIIFRHDPTNVGVATHYLDIDKIIVTTAEDSLMKASIDAIKERTNNLPDLPADESASSFIVDTNGNVNNILSGVDALTQLTLAGGDGDLAAILVDTGTTLPVLIGDFTGTGAITFTYTLYTNESAETGPIDNATVWVTTDEAGTTVVANGMTNSSGVVIFYLDAGDYYFWRSAAGYNFSNPDLETLS